MRVAIHQPEHMPWLGFFHKLTMADTLIVLDNVQFRKNYFQNRNKIRTANGWSWLNVPVKYEFGQYIKDVIIDNSSKRWKKKYWDTVYLSYKKADYSNKYSQAIKSILDDEWRYISDLNLSLILKFIEFLGIDIAVKKASDLDVQGKGSELLLNICQKLDAKTYISGVSGRDYLNTKDFQGAGIEVVFQEFHHPVYRQLHKPFIPCMSVIDLLFNYGGKSLDVIKGVDIPVMEEVFL